MNDLSTALADQHVSALQAQACLDRLQRLADCCRPSVLRRTASAAVQWLRRGQLGPGYVCC